MVGGKKDKRLKKARNNPGNVTFDELGAILEDNGFKLDRVNGSHHVFEHEETGEPLIIPKHGKNVSAVYVKQAIDAIDRLGGSDAD